MEIAAWSAIANIYLEHPRERAGPVSPERFRRLIEAPGYPFDAGYREFVIRFGGGHIGLLPVYGLRRADSMGTIDGAETAPEVTAVYRKLKWPSVDRWLVFSVDHGGSPIGFAEDCKIYLCEQVRGYQVSLFANSFEEFVLARCLRLKDWATSSRLG